MEKGQSALQRANRVKRFWARRCAPMPSSQVSLTSCDSHPHPTSTHIGLSAEHGTYLFVFNTLHGRDFVYRCVSTKWKCGGPAIGREVELARFNPQTGRHRESNCTSTKMVSSRVF